MADREKSLGDMDFITIPSGLVAKGHKLRVSGPWTIGSNAAILIDPVTGVLNAGADPRVEAYAWAR